MNILSGTIHELPVDLHQTLVSNSDVLERRNSLTPLARNERICRVTIVKKEETRQEHLQRLCEDLRNGKRRPCCRPGCPHRKESAKKWFKGIEK